MNDTQREWFDVHTFPQTWFLLKDDMTPIHFDLIATTKEYTKGFKQALKEGGLGYKWQDEELPRIRGKSINTSMTKISVP